MSTFFNGDDEISVFRQVADRSPAKPRNLKVNNRKTVLDLLRKHGEMSASELSELSDLSRTTVMKTLNHFISTGFVTSEGKGESTNEGGKKPEIFSFNAQKAYICTIAIYADQVCCGITDLASKMLIRLKLAHSPNEKLKTIIENASILIMAAIDSAHIKLNGLLGVAVCCDGIVDRARGIIQNATHFPSWGNDIPFGELMHFALGKKNLMVVVESSVRMLGIAELSVAPSLSQKTVITFFGDIGVGSCILKHGKLLSSNHAFMGELGHLIVNPQGTELCYCGNKGCLEMTVSEQRILIKARREHSAWPESRLCDMAESGALALENIFSAADGGDSFARYLVDFMVKYFSIVIHNTIITHDPDIIILQGCYANAGSYFLGALTERVKAMQFSGFGETAYLRFSNINLKKAYITGPAYYLIEEFFTNEELYEM